MTGVLSSAKALIGFHGKHSSPFMESCEVNLILLVIFIIFSLNANYICSSLDADAERWPWPTPFCNLTEPIARYTNDSKFVSNVNTALKSLHVDVKNTSQGRFNSVVYGQSPNQIYALLQCRGDATAEECHNCSQQAKTDVLNHCGVYRGSRVWSKFCFLRYNGNYDFIGHLDTAGDNSYSDFNASSDPAAYIEAAKQLLSNLSSNITSGSARNRYASGSINDASSDPADAAKQLLSNLASNITSESAMNRYASGSINDSRQFHKISALAQCWGDISLHDCTKCLLIKIDQLFKNNPGRLGARGLAGSCIIQYEEKSSFNDSQKATSKIPINSQKATSKIPIILGVFGGLLLLFIVAIVFGTRRRFKYAIFGRRGGGEQPTSEDQVLNTIPSLSNVFTVYKMETLVAATENFHDNNKLGEGGFGAVYKGTCPDGSEIAVKKLSLKSKQGKKEFMNEIKLVAKIQHRNLVKLLGCCVVGSERLFVYEYLPNNSLDKILFDPNKRRQLDWQTRFSIILGVTRGLLYLHEDSQLRIIHRDIKASNILLDSKLNARIADFGLARLFHEDETNVWTMVAGTRGYMAPEYAIHGQLSSKADVYSFGILLLELMSGRKNMDFNLSLEMHILLEWTWRLYKRGNIMDLIDLTILETCNDHEQASRCVRVGLLCTQANSSLRPSMSTVNLMLSTKFMLLPDPTKPGFVSSVPTHGTSNPGHYKGGDPQIREGEQPTSDGQDTTPIFSNVFTLFRKETLVAATQNFHDNNKLGEGGFGAVYKGTCPDGSEIAVKKLYLKSTQGIKEFLNEVELVAKIQHRNLVKLLGCCAEGSERLLVYEYLPNNSFDKILFDRNKRRQLDWQKRFNIILGVTRGLLYLHEDSHLRIIHRDIKAGNILLDSQMNPKIADFGLARLFDEDETNVRTIVAGTRGYMAPEYAMHGQLSAKADVYSFGTLLLELMSGRKNTDFNLSPEKQILLEWAWGLYKRGNIVDMIDPAIIETCGSDHEQALRCIHVGLLCTQGNPSLRPSMSTVNVMLSTDAMVLPDPTKPAFVNSVATHHTNTNSVSPHPSVVI